MVYPVDRAEDGIDEVLILVWGKDEMRVIIAADIPGRLMSDIAQRQNNGQLAAGSDFVKSE